MARKTYARRFKWVLLEGIQLAQGKANYRKLRDWYLTRYYGPA